METAVIYARYSSDNQTEQSIEGQLRVCQEYAKNNDILLLDTYIDRAMTGTNDNRADFQRMLKDSARNHWDYVLVYKIDRFSRNKYETAIHKKTLKDNGTRLLSATEYIPDSPEGIILESMLEGYAEYYSAELSQKIRRGMNESRQKGNYTGGYVLYGYKIVDKKVVIDEHQAEIVRYIYEQYSTGVYVKDILKALNEKGVIHRGKPFASNTVYGILKNEKYSGTYKRGNEVFEKTFPRIVPQEVFEKVRKKVEQNKYGKKNGKEPYLLRFKVTCGYCGKPISSDTGTSRNGTVKYYYKCWNRKHNGNCKKEVIRKDMLETMVINAVIEQLTNQKSMNELVHGLLKIQDTQIEESSMLNVLLHDKRKVETSLNNIVSAIEQGIISNTTNKRLRELEEQQAQLEKQILIERSKLAVKMSEEDIREFYESALTLESQMLVNYLIKEVVLYDDKMIIRYNNPLRKSLDENQGFFFYDKNVSYTYTIPNKPTVYEIKMNVKIVV